MPALHNPRHERFSQAIAAGKNGTDAYGAAGFTANRHAARVNASRLLAQASIKARVAEILANDERINAKATARAIERAALSKEDIIEMLLADRQLARKTRHAARAPRAPKRP